jgi:hypothetical protein
VNPRIRRLAAIATLAPLAACSWVPMPRLEGSPQPMTSTRLDYLGYRAEGGQNPWMVARAGESLMPADNPLRLKVRLAGPYAIGDLNSDGRPDAAVITATETGGSGTFIALAAVVDDQGTPRQVAGVPLGDRVKVGSVSIADGTIEISLTRQGPNDPLCCPTEQATLRYRLDSTRLVPAKP